MRYFIESNTDEVSLNIKKRINDALNSNKEFILSEDKPELVISIGGDGRLLKSAHKYIDRIESIAFVGISTGTVGFLCDFKCDEVEEFISMLIEKTPHYKASRLVEVEIGNSINYYINEFRIEKIFKVLECDIYINGLFFETFKGNGLNISSSIGSTAYNKSLGGPIIHPNNSVLILGEIASLDYQNHHSLHNSVILRDYDVITIKGTFANTIIGGDIHCQMIKDINEHQIVIKLSDKAINFAHYRQYDYYNKVKNSFLGDR